MRPQRIVSLLPSTTEILFDLGAGDDVIGVTFECDHPAQARERRIVSSTTMPEGLDPAGIDAYVARAAAAGEDLYRLDAGALADLDPDLVLTQDLCAVCAIDVGSVDEALDHLGCRAEVLSFDPHTLAEIRDSVLRIGAAVGRPDDASRLAAPLEALVEQAAAPPTGARRPRVVVLEWTDPPYAPGHWIPEMVEAAGGECALGTAGAKSVRVTWDDVHAARPDLVVVAPCGYDRPAAQEQADRMVAAGLLPSGVPVHPVDANGHWARPGPRVVDGVADLRSALEGHGLLG
ncbi:ABC transporter substrate-binding protein [Nocardioides sp. 31GB23]|uniref:ABC transporter substrate-binding protein n=1 Tax=Nocardioides sp. 31GB23 TaxID=3156065 RepID=UPI0032AF99E9